MSIYAVSDLHLSLTDPNKSMEYFGEQWIDYVQRIKTNWLNTVRPNDTVIIPGDISWGMTLEDCKEDFRFIDNLPGNKIVLKGNHDYYFSTATKVKAFLKENKLNSIEILYNNSYFIEGYNICGTRLWGQTDDELTDDSKIIKREIIRLKLSLDSISDKNAPIIVATHFPPFRPEIKELLQKYNVRTCIYGHLHGKGHNMVREGIIDGVMYRMVSGDYTGFKLIKL